MKESIKNLFRIKAVKEIKTTCSCNLLMDKFIGLENKIKMFPASISRQSSAYQKNILNPISDRLEYIVQKINYNDKKLDSLSEYIKERFNTFHREPEFRKRIDDLNKQIEDLIISKHSLSDHLSTRIYNLEEEFKTLLMSL